MNYSKLADAVDMATTLDTFTQIFMARGGPQDMVLFAVSDGSDIGGVAVPDATMKVAPELAVLRTWHKIDVLEPPLQWALLAGHADAPDRFGITLGSGRSDR